MSRTPRAILALLLTCCAAWALACGGDEPSGGDRGPSGGGSWGGAATPVAAVPVQAAAVERRTISSFIETNGTLEAENEVDIVARISAPIVDLRAEEGMAVRKGQVLARLDRTELANEVEVARVNLDETQLGYERATNLNEQQLISSEDYQAALSRYNTAKAQLEGNEILLSYSEITAPFSGLIVSRYVDFAQQVSPNTALFRLSDFDPLLCPIQVPERELTKLRIGQHSYLEVEAWPGERFEASVLRISPIVDSATGTVKVTLEVDAQDKLRPGMFARVYIETESRADALVIPKSALSLESIGETVYVVAGGVAARREVRLGFTEGDSVEVLEGVAENEEVVVIGQDGLSDGTPINVIGREGERAAAAAPGQPGGAQPAQGSPATTQGPGGPGGRPDLAKMTPEQLERAKEFMRTRGMTEEQIEERIRQARSRSQEGSGPGSGR